MVVYKFSNLCTELFSGLYIEVKAVQCDVSKSCVFHKIMKLYNNIVLIVRRVGEDLLRMLLYNL